MPVSRRVLLVSAAALLLASPAAAGGEPAGGWGRWFPADAPERTWRLVDHADGASPRMTVAHERLDADRFRLAFSGKPGQPPDDVDLEAFRRCPGVDGGPPWLWLDRYVDLDTATGESSSHPVFHHRITYTPAGGEPRDLVADGTYARNGGRGQPYLTLGPDAGAYRIQVWGTIAEPDPAVAVWHWHWDATVTPGVEVENANLGGGPRPALRVREAWWSTFDGDPAGRWQAPGTGEIDAAGVPTGEGTTPSRTVWHGENLLPYLVIGTPAGEPFWETAEVRVTGAGG